MKRCSLLMMAAVAMLPALVALGADDRSTLAKRILDVSGIRGGVIVHVGCEDGSLTAALRANQRFLVYGLSRNADDVATARQRLDSLGLCGPVSIEAWSGFSLPVIDNFANLVVLSEPSALDRGELLRALAPGGVAVAVEGEQSVREIVRKPWPEEMDQWTHYLHDPSGNAVAHDTLIEPPRRYQWVADQRYSRQHDHMSSVNAVVSAGGRIFYVIDEAPRASILIPPDWRLVARDAFNGTLLWERKIDTWHHHLWRLKSGPQLLTRRLVAVGDRVYVTLGIDAPLSVLDAATGETIKTFDHTKVTEEVLCLDGMLVLSVAAEGQPLRSDPSRRYRSVSEIAEQVTDPIWTEAPRTLMALDAATGDVRWKTKTNLVSMSLTADPQHVVFHDGKVLQCLDRGTGERIWTSEPLPVKRPMRSSGGATVVIYDDVVFYSGQAAAEKYEDNRSTTMFALSMKDGKTLWKAEHPPCGHMGTPDDILVMKGLVWVGDVAKGSDSGAMVGRDLHTGEIKSRFTPDVETHWFHHRCYRAKATDKYLLFSRTGIEFIDPDTEHWICHHWVRGACLYGILPCNGLIYAPQHPCACYIEAKLYGFNAIAPPSPGSSVRKSVPDRERLERGPAYKTAGEPVAEAVRDDWPTFRHDAARSGATPSAVPLDGLKTAWSTNIGGKVTSPVMAGGKVLVASADQHTLHALDAETGSEVWQFIAGGRIDSPPTVWRGRVLFGSADGYVYCVQLSDGRLAWRYRVAPEHRRMLAFDQLESVWPVHGSVLVLNDAVYCVAGRSMFLDGGLRFVRLDPMTGRKLSETIFDDRDPDTGENLQIHVTGLNMPVALPDVLSSDGKYVYMRSLPIQLDGTRKFVEYISLKDLEGDDRHLFSPTGFLDDTLWHRTYWVYGRAFASGAGGYSQAGRVEPAGRLLVVGDDTIYGYGRHWNYYRWTTPLEFELFATRKDPRIVQAGTERKPIKKQGRRTGQSRVLPVTRFVTKWSNDVSVQVTAMVLSGGTLFAAGPPDVEDEEVAVNSLDDPAVGRKLAEQFEAFRGKRGGRLVAVSPDDGRLLAAYRLDWAPRFDGLIAAKGCLFATTADGKVVCLAPQQGQPLAQADDVTYTPRDR